MAKQGILIWLLGEYIQPSTPETFTFHYFQQGGFIYQPYDRNLLLHA